jgi:hypothetical protein
MVQFTNAPRLNVPGEAHFRTIHPGDQARMVYTDGYWLYSHDHHLLFMKWCKKEFLVVNNYFKQIHWSNDLCKQNACVSLGSQSKAHKNKNRNTKTKHVKTQFRYPTHMQEVTREGHGAVYRCLFLFLPLPTCRAPPVAVDFLFFETPPVDFFRI